jgi:hypothetical protein
MILCRNRIALIQKEEERARRKIQETKDRAAEIIALRNENEQRVKAYVNAASEIQTLHKVLIAKNREQEIEGKKAKAQRFQMLYQKRHEGVQEMLMEKKYLTQLMLQEQSQLILRKQQQAEEIKRKEEEFRKKKELEKLQKEEARKAIYAKKLAEEA